MRIVASDQARSNEPNENVVGRPSLSASQSAWVRNAVTAMNASGNSAESPKQVSPPTIDQRPNAAPGAAPLASPPRRSGRRAHVFARVSRRIWKMPITSTSAISVIPSAEA